MATKKVTTATTKDAGSALYSLSAVVDEGEGVGIQLDAVPQMASNSSSFMFDSIFKSVTCIKG